MRNFRIEWPVILPRVRYLGTLLLEETGVMLARSEVVELLSISLVSLVHVHSQSLIDVVLTTNKEWICDSGVLCHSMSDHSAAYCIYQSALRSQASYVTETWNVFVLIALDMIYTGYHGWFVKCLMMWTINTTLFMLHWRWGNVESGCAETKLILLQLRKELSEQNFWLYKPMKNHVNSKLRRASKERVFSTSSIQRIPYTTSLLEEC